MDIVAAQCSDTWPGVLGEVEAAMVSVVAALAESETVRINVLDEAHERHVRRLLEAATRVHEIIFHRIPTNDAWCRDHGPIFVASHRSELMALDFEFNAWGGKYSPYDADAAAGGVMASALGVPRFAPGMVLEGGSVDVNGIGSLLTTSQCLLNPNRNPRLDRAAIEARLKSGLGASQVIWLDGGIDGDDTDGHVDAVARFVDSNRVVAAVERDAKTTPIIARSPPTESGWRMCGLTGVSRLDRGGSCRCLKPLFRRGQASARQLCEFLRG